ncbi:MAG: choice-of-anchor I family protein [Stenomitos frigidus ULC029]
MPLSTGNIAIVGFNADGNDNLAFVALVDIPAGETIYFEDNEWNGTGFIDTNESAFNWTSTTPITAGTIVRIDNIGTGTIAASTGTVTTPVAGRGTNRGLAASDEVLYAYQGTPGTPTTFLTAVANSGFSATNGLLTGTGLTVGTTALDLSAVDPGADIGAYNGSRSGQTSFSGYLASINNAANWQTQDAGGDQGSDGTAPDVPFSTTAFTLGAGGGGTPTVNLAVSTNTGSEAGQTIVTVTATASSAVTGDQTVSLGVSGTGITAGDYALSANTITIPNGATTGTVTFTVVDDAIAEGTETALLTISNPSAGMTLGGTASQSIAIADNDSAAQSGILQKIGSFTSANGAEIPAFDPGSDRLFTVAGSTVEILSVSNTGALTLTGALTPGFTPPAGTNVLPNSVAVKNGIVAVAYAVVDATTNAQQTGRVSFYNAADGTFLNSVAVGFLPDMLTFTPDGTKVLVANEGEPNSYGQATSFDPEGSVSVIDLAGGVASATVRNASFTSFNSQIDALRASGVRITGPGATVAQDLEPEYIAVAPDGLTAQVTLQENNAIAILDIASATITQIIPLGLKDFSKGLPTLTTYDFTNLPVLGTTATVNPSNPSQTVAGQEIRLGGFSGLHFEGVAANGNLKFITHTDRGPNGEPSGSNRPFPLPDFQPQLVRFELNQSTGAIAITEQIGLKRADGTPLTGLPNLQGVAGTAYSDEVPVDLFGNPLSNDKLGGDFEGIVVAADGSFWMADEYRPAIYHFSSSGQLLDRLIPQGTPTSGGEFGTPVLPAVYAQRRTNRGFEAIALEGNKLYAFIQSAIDNPDLANDNTSRNSRNLRVVELDITTNTVTGEYLYLLDSLAGSGSARTDKLGDAVSLGNGKFLVVERDDRSTTSANKLIYEIDLRGATNINNPSNLTGLPAGKTIEQLSVAELVASNLQPVSKRLVTNAAALGYTGVEKLEGLALINANTLAIINDNDFGVGGSTASNGQLAGATVPSTIKLGIVEFNQSNGLDASDRDGGINIRNQPVFGLYQPDAIASYTANGQTYYITANEGDARDYTGFAEEVRVGAAVLDPTVFPNAATLQNNANLGRLTVSRTTSDKDGDGDLDQLQMLGARSFSIRDANGTLVFDSGDQLERLTATQAPTLFNSDGTAASFDTRSDNKGPEPEGVAIGVINNRTYAFIGLERVGDVIVYEVTNPNKPVFVQYINTPEDLGAEGLAFIAAADSPTGKPLLATTNEVSKTVALFEVKPSTRISDIQGTSHTSPLNGQAVTGVAGIVTVLRTNGFYLQDPNPDSSDATSEGIFVFTSSAPTVQVGDAIQVSGTVSEFRAGGASSANLSTTQISSPTITVVSSGNALPTATILGNGGRTIPTSVINNDGTGNVETSGTFDPATDGIDFYESLEGMLVQVNNPIATSPTATFGTSQEIWVLADNGANATSRTARGGSLINASDFNPERIQIDDLNNALVLPEVNVGAQLSTITGIVNYDFGNFEVLVSTAPTVVQASPLQREITNLIGSPNDLTIANFNVENLDPVVEDINKVQGRNSNNVDDDLGTGKFDALAQAIVNNLKTPDIISLEEIQDNTGAEIGDGVVASDVTLNLLIDRIVAAGGPRYEFQVLNPVEGQDGGQPGGNIRVGFLFNPNRVSFVEGSLQRLTDPNPAESDSFAGDDFASSRKPLVGTFLFNGQAVTIVANHFNSKGGDQPLFGRFQPPTLTSEAQRLQQATIVRDFVQSVLAADSNANVVVAGDLNDFEFSNPVNLVESAGLTNLIETLPANERYTYNFQGNAQTLDYILVSGNLLNQLNGFDVVHFNSEFADQISDHDPSVARFRFNSAPTALALSTTSLDENVPANTLVGNFTTTDPDPGNTFTYSLVAGAGDSGNSAFTINSNQLQINLSPDFETTSSYSIRVRTTDQGGLSLDSVLTIAINDINEIFGDARNNTLLGTLRNDTIYAGGGNDTVFGLGGNDLVFGEGGNDRLFGGLGNDYIDGGSGNDTITDLGGTNTIFGGAGNDTILAGFGTNLIDGGAGNDTIYLSFGEDTIALARGNGNDTVYNYNAGSTRFSLGAGLTFDELTIAQSGSSTSIRVGGERLASLAGVQASSVTASSFITA